MNNNKEIIAFVCLLLLLGAGMAMMYAKRANKDYRIEIIKEGVRQGIEESKQK